LISKAQRGLSGAVRDGNGKQGAKATGSNETAHPSDQRGSINLIMTIRQFSTGWRDDQVWDFNEQSLKSR
jgi:hypothetical protein